MSVGGVGVTSAMNTPNQRMVVWQGALEWQEKKDNRNEVHQITCRMTSLVVNGEPEMKADHWDTTLKMQLTPKHILSIVGNTPFKNVKIVMFQPDQTHALDSLSNLLSRGAAGLICVSHSSPRQQSDVRVIILLYSSEKKAYVGYIPNDQQAFVSKIKSVVQNARKTQTTQNTARPSIQGAGTSHMVVPGNTGLQSSPSGADIDARTININIQDPQQI